MAGYIINFFPKDQRNFYHLGGGHRQTVKSGNKIKGLSKIMSGSYVYVLIYVTRLEPKAAVMTIFKFAG